MGQNEIILKVPSPFFFTTGGRWFDPRLGQYSFQGLMIVIANRIRSSLTAVCRFYNGYVGEQPVPWKEYCAEYWLKELRESMDGCTVCSNTHTTEILLKIALNNNQSINHVFTEQRKFTKHRARVKSKAQWTSQHGWHTERPKLRQTQSYTKVKP